VRLSSSEKAMPTRQVGSLSIGASSRCFVVGF
jgi:hypothetical protein